MCKSDRIEPKIILASTSPRRRELLESIGVAFTVKTNEIDESTRSGETPKDYVQRLANQKAEAVRQGLPEEKKHTTMVIAADTSVVIDQLILGKPSDQREASAMLKRLSGRAHEVLTGFAVLQGSEKIIQTVRTKIKFRLLSDQEIRAYVKTGEPMDKAGAYAIQGEGKAFVDTIDGSYTNVVGLPLDEIQRVLKNWEPKIEFKKLDR